MKTNDIETRHLRTRRLALKVSAILAGVLWLDATTQPLPAQTSPVFTRITTGPLVTDLGTSSVGSIGDYDNDGFPDVFAVRYLNGLSGRSCLYHNNGDGTFVGVTNSVFPMSRGEYYMGIWGDLDNDGRLDLFVTDGFATVPSFFAFNNGNGSFTQLDFGMQSPWGASMADYDQDGLLDLFLTRGTPVTTNRLYRNLGGRRFQAMTRTEVGDILSSAPTYGSAAWADYDDDSRVDVFASSNTNYNRCQMYHNEGGRFRSVTNQVTLDANAISGVTAAWGDYDNDGRTDLVAGTWGSASYIYRNLGSGNFARASIGLSLPSSVAVTWADYDNDGFLDLLMTWVPSPQRGCALFRNNGNGTFTSITSGAIVGTPPPPAPSGCYSANWFDYDNNGFLDLFVANGDDVGNQQLVNYLFRNEGNTNAWLKVKLVGTVSNRDAIGAKVRVKATFAGASRWQRREIATGDSWGGNNNPIAHFGLRDATIVETLRVEWPSGQVTELTNVAVRQSLTITEAPGLRATGLVEGAMRMQLTAHPGMNIELRVTNNLPINFKTVPYTDWPLWQTVLQTNRTMTVTDPDAGSDPWRFYGARVP